MLHCLWCNIQPGQVVYRLRPVEATPAQTRKRRSYRGVAPAQRDADRRGRLMAAGLEQFGTDGYNAVSVSRLCDAAGVASRNFYALFSDRETLFLALYDELTAQGLKQIAGASAAAPAELDARLRAGICAAVEFYADPRRSRIVFMEILGLSPRAEQHRHQAMSGSVEVAGEVMAGLIAERAIPPRDVRLTAIALVGAFAELMVHRTVTGGDPSAEDIVGELLGLFRAALAAEPAPAAP